MRKARKTAATDKRKELTVAASYKALAANEEWLDGEKERSAARSK